MLLNSNSVPQGLFKTFSQPPAPPGQDIPASHPHLVRVIDPVSMTPIVARIAIVILAHLNPWSLWRRLMRRVLPMVD